MTWHKPKYMRKGNLRHIMNKLIFDRTQLDVTNDTWKGQYNASDFNRVETWCSYLATNLQLLGYMINITTKTNWVQSDMREQSEMLRIKNNILSIMTGFHYLTKIYASVDNWDYIKANRWEQILNEINNMMVGMQDWFVYGGVANGGQNRLWQHRFRQFYDASPQTTWADFENETWGDFTNETWGDL